ncbi:MAG: hypothetical protein BWY66_01676 [bacterium ADurb.Bin374]|nr:MAG: hypothetical protein BWY66_01676 [bacterium ADurb.Bin374]
MRFVKLCSVAVPRFVQGTISAPPFVVPMHTSYFSTPLPFSTADQLACNTVGMPEYSPSSITTGLAGAVLSTQIPSEYAPQVLSRPDLSLTRMRAR